MQALRSFLSRLRTPARPGGADGDILDQAADMLAAPTGPLRLLPPEAAIVARYLQPTRIASGTTFIKEGDATATDFLLMVLEGDVVVESIVVSRTDPITVRVLGPGTMHGDAGLLDGQPRSASCTAGTDIVGVILTRDSLNRLLSDHPEVCAKFLIAIGGSLAARLRESTQTLKRYVQLTRMLQQEIDRLMPDK